MRCLRLWIFAKSFDADLIWFAKVYKGPDMTQEDWEESAVHRPEHRLHQDFLQVMRHPNMLDPHIDWTNMKQFVNTQSGRDLYSPLVIQGNSLPVIDSNFKALRSARTFARQSARAG